MATAKPERILNTNPNLMVAIVTMLVATAEKVTYLPIIAWLLEGTDDAPTPVTVLGPQGLGPQPIDDAVALLYDQSSRKVLVGEEWVALKDLRGLLEEEGYFDGQDAVHEDDPDTSGAEEDEDTDPPREAA